MTNDKLINGYAFDSSNSLRASIHVRLAKNAEKKLEKMYGSTRDFRRNKSLSNKRSGSSNEFSRHFNISWPYTVKTSVRKIYR
jgi:hypothetical protein